MKSLFVSGGVAFLISLIGTPLLIGWLRTHDIGQRCFAIGDNARK